MTGSPYDTPRGTRDFVPAELALRNHVERVMRTTFESFAFRPVRTPMFEAFDLFAARAGDEILESMFTFASDAGRYALRPELTSPVCRMVAAGKLDDLPRPYKLYYVGPCFRYCRPQVGRWREFDQAGIELIGAADPLADAEVVAVAMRTLVNLGIPASELRLRVGNVGIFRSLLAVDGTNERVLSVQDEVLHDIDHLVHLSEVCDAVSAAGDVTEAESVFLNAQWRLLRQIQKQTQYTGEHAIPKEADPPTREEWVDRATTLPALAEATYREAWRTEQDLGDEVADRLIGVASVRGPVTDAIARARTFVEGTPAVAAFERLEAVCNWLEFFGVTEFNVVLGTVRNLDFYTGTVFEIDAPLLGERTQICGGGRYDELVERFGGPKLPATGFAFGFDRLVEVVRQTTADAPAWTANGIDVFVTTADASLRGDVVRLADTLRQNVEASDEGLRVATDLRGEPSEALGVARGSGARLIVVVDGKSQDDGSYEVHAGGMEGTSTALGRKPAVDIPNLVRMTTG
jgi:histidyl-tRNA synthetase